MKTLIAASAAALMSSTLANAQELRLPQSDFEMTLRIHDRSNDQEQEIEMEMRHRAGDFRMEGEFQGHSAILLASPADRMLTVLADMGGARMAIQMPMDDDVTLPLADERFGEVVGSDRVAGEPCTIYRVEDEDIPGGEALGCMTDDNIVLRVTDMDNVPMLVATQFARRAQDASLFTVPAGYQIMQMPAGMSFPR
ncbi:hypothetical protein AB6B38_02145 [Glycocaulis abyssi]|uniref:DUF4412 domain-containing protein n=1 Tax=Glycocaulis abyssi TaxID=1433403 RepID=A0ABV9NBG4_9PROT